MVVNSGFSNLKAFQHTWGIDGFKNHYRFEQFLAVVLQTRLVATEAPLEQDCEPNRRAFGASCSNRLRDPRLLAHPLCFGHSAVLPEFFGWGS